VLATGRDAFSADRLRHNWGRVRAGFAALAGLARLVEHLQSWRRLDHSAGACLLLLLLARAPSAALGAAWLALAWRVWRGRPLLGGRWGERGGRGAAEEGEEVPAAGMAELRRRYESLQAFVLQVQNVLDDVASLLERAQHALSWTDATASAMFVVACAAMGLLLWLLGASAVLALALAWLLRPPRLRDPLPAPPEAFFGRLPARG
jgi:hypothetical protein